MPLLGLTEIILGIITNMIDLGNFFLLIFYFPKTENWLKSLMEQKKSRETSLDLNED